MEHWFTADTHYRHQNLVRGVSQWENKRDCRDFDTLEEHDNLIINNINKYVKEEDSLWHIGDWSLGGPDNIWEFRKQINCKNIHLILGNHDQHIANNKLLTNCRRTKALSEEIIDGKPECNFTLVYAQDLFKSISQIYRRKFNNVEYVMCHYAMRTWPNAYKDAIMIFGHSHGLLGEYEKLLKNEENEHLYNRTKTFYKTLDVGLDSINNIFGEMRPVNINEISAFMEDRQSFKDNR